MRYHLTLVKMVIIKKSTNNKRWRGCGEKGTVLHCWWECKMVQPLQRTVWRFLKKLKIELPYDSATLLLGIYPEKTIIRKDKWTPTFTAVLFTIAKIWKQPKWPSTNEWTKKMWYKDFPGGPVVKDPPANAGDTGSIPGPGRSHMPRSNLSPCATTTEPASHSYCAHVPRACAP